MCLDPTCSKNPSNFFPANLTFRASSPTANASAIWCCSRLLLLLGCFRFRSGCSASFCLPRSTTAFLARFCFSATSGGSTFLRSRLLFLLCGSRSRRGAWNLLRPAASDFGFLGRLILRVIVGSALHACLWRVGIFRLVLVDIACGFVRNVILT